MNEETRSAEMGLDLCTVGGLGMEIARSMRGAEAAMRQRNGENQRMGYGGKVRLCLTRGKVQPIFLTSASMWGFGLVRWRMGQQLL